VAGRRPRHPVGWLLLGVGLAVALSVVVEWYAKYGLVVRPGSLPGAEYLPGFAVLGFTVIALACAGFVLLLTPTGKLPSPRWRWWARVAAAAPVVVVLGSVVQPDPLAPDYHGNALAAGLLLVALVAGCCPRAPAWSWPRPPWVWRRCSSRPAAASRPPWTAGSTGAATTPP
jgi:hypothetical protein